MINDVASHLQAMEEGSDFVLRNGRVRVVCVPDLLRFSVLAGGGGEADRGYESQPVRRLRWGRADTWRDMVSIYSGRRPQDFLVAGCGV